ncbi:MAG: NYN domain-containing protein [Deltaproteobacteria bacterium]|nr:NYN domain-containing protein [Deltaproteobacteria bacterium]
MSTRIVIDGYNLIRQSDQLINLEAISLEEGRMGLIRLLADYKKIKGNLITVVFDGWKSDNIGSSRDKVQGIDIIYSGRGDKADDVIKGMAHELRDKIVVVTSDKDIANHAKKKGAVVISSPEFEMKVRMTVGGDDFSDFGDEEDYEVRSGTKKKGPARRLSKEERRKKSKLNKL